MPPSKTPIGPTAARRQRDAQRNDNLHRLEHQVRADRIAAVRGKLKRSADATIEKLAEQVNQADGRSLGAEEWRTFKSSTGGVRALMLQDATLAELENEHRVKATVEASIISEERTYRRGGPHSWFADVAAASGVGLGGSPELRADAQARLDRHGVELRGEIRAASKEGRRAAEIIREHARQGRDDPEIHRRAADRAVTEHRAGSSSTLGSFAAPAYLLDEFATYRLEGAIFAGQCRQLGLPAYGLTVTVPAFTAAATTAVQSENAAVSSSVPTTQNLTANVQTVAGQVSLSQQLYDRGGGAGSAFDVMLAQQLAESYGQQLDVLALTAALSGAGAVTYTAGSFALAGTSGDGGFVSKLAAAKLAVRTAAGTLGQPSHLFVQPARWEAVAAWSDSSGRPYLVPDYVGMSQPQPPAAGWTGYRLNGLAVYEDLNIPVPGTGSDQAVVADMRHVLMFTTPDAPQVRVISAAGAGSLMPAVQMFSYAAVLAKHTAAVQTVGGSGMTAPAL